LKEQSTYSFNEKSKKAEHQNRAYSSLAFFSELPISSPGRTPLPTHPHNLINTDTVTQRREREREVLQRQYAV
jgi:hypothetical protein